MLDNLGINLTVTLIQVVAFLILFVVMWRFFFARITESMLKREDEVNRILHDIDMKQKTVDQQMKDYARRIQEIEQQATLKIQEAVKQGQQVRAEIEAESKKRADEELARGKAMIQKEREQAMANVQREATRLAGEIAQRVLAEPIAQAGRRA